jgi:DNA-binding response OmpR family regulator
MERVLIVSDDEGLLIDLCRSLRAEGCTVDFLRNGARGLAEALVGGYDLVVLGTVLPVMDGYTICRRMREQGSETPILMFGPQPSESDRVLGFELGADDFVSEQCGAGELRCRARALLRRPTMRPSTHPPVVFDDIRVDFQRRTVTRAGAAVALTPTEFDILSTLVEHAGEALRRDTILMAVRHGHAKVFPRTVDSHIAHLRAKLGESSERPTHIVSVRGFGYRFDS